MAYQMNNKFKYTNKFSANNFHKFSTSNPHVFTQKPLTQFKHQFSYQKPNSTFPSPQSTLLKQSIESSNKLDELLNKCKQIGSSSSTSVPVVAKPSIVTNDLKYINNYKLVKNPISSSPMRPLSTKSSIHKSKFKIINKKTKLKNFDRTSLFSNRSVVNVSKNRFKFISKTSLVCPKIPLIRTMRNKNLFKIDNLKKTKRIKKNLFKLDKRFVNPNVVRNRFKLVNPVLRSDLKINNKILIASNLIQRSKMTINRTLKKSQNVTNLVVKKNLSLNKKIEKKYCLFYNRFGRCSRGENCTFIHDPKRISLCPRFLRGTCKVENCPFSHEISPEKMPLCSFFASGCCNRENCPYQHVNYGKDAKFCVDFAKGLCPLGTKCEHIHLIECPDFEANKKCPRGKQCPLLHRKKSKKITKNSDKSETLSFVPDFKPRDETSIQIKEPTLKVEDDSNKEFKLRPSFGAKKQ